MVKLYMVKLCMVNKACATVEEHSFSCA